MPNPQSDTRPSQRPHPNILHSAEFNAGRKKFFLDLIENDRGKVVRITEDVNGRRDRIMVPIEALPDLIRALKDLEQKA